VAGDSEGDGREAEGLHTRSYSFSTRPLVCITAKNTHSPPVHPKDPGRHILDSSENLYSIGQSSPGTASSRGYLVPCCPGSPVPCASLLAHRRVGSDTGIDEDGDGDGDGDGDRDGSRGGSG
jgi:hypothetical protein